MTDTIQTITKSFKGYGGVEYEETYEVYENGRKFLRRVVYTKGDRKAIVEFMSGNIPWGRSNAYMVPIAPAGKTRSYKDRHNAQAKAIEYVCGK